MNADELNKPDNCEPSDPIEGENFGYEERMLRNALLKRQVAKPDTEDEWQRFIAAHRKHSPNRYARIWWGVGGAISGIAATLLILLMVGVLRPGSTLHPHDSSLYVFSAIDKNQDIIITAESFHEQQSPTPDLAMSHSEKTADEKGASKTLVTEKIDKEAIEVLDMRQVKATPGMMEERSVSTPRGKELRIILADNTEVLLNGESTLKFPVRFLGDLRTVYLQGEAYFSVAKDEKKPFNVVSDNFRTTALGTEFDVRAYKQADLRVSLIQGSVKVEDLTDGQEVILQPGQDVVNQDGKMVVSSIDTKAFQYWKDGYFYFNDVPLIDVLIELGRWYNLNIELEKRSLMSYRLHMVAKRDEPAEDVIERLNKFSYINATINGNSVRVEESASTTHF